MNRETEFNFATLPTTEIGRSKFNRSFNHATTFNNGEIIPIYCEHVMPGDTVNLNVGSVIRMLTPLTPVMDSLYADIMFFYVPYRLIWDNFKFFLGENEGVWTQPNDYRIPKIKLCANYGGDSSHVVEAGSLLNYLGIPLGLGQANGTSSSQCLSINHLPLRAYCKIYNDWWKSEAVEKDLYYQTGDTVTAFASRSYFETVLPTAASYPNRCAMGAIPAKANREFDYFSACLPEPQKGPTVFLPLNGTAPVVYGKYYNTLDNKWDDRTGVTGKSFAYTTTGLTAFDDMYFTEGQTTAPTALSNSSDQSLIVDLENATGASINAIRQAFAIQKFYERQARYGTRYGEVIQGHFNTTNPDIMINRSEYLGGKRFPISINQVVAQGNDSSGIPLGDTGAYSVTSDVSDDIFTKSFTEWGIVMGVVVTRTHRSYQQGINKFWFMDKITDMYWPEFANLGEQVVKQGEIYAQDGANIADNDVAFGYQEAWAHYRYSPDLITGELSSLYSQSLDIWHYGDYYASAPTLNAFWMEEQKTNVNRTLAYQTGHQFKADFYFKATWTRPMPLYSIPGLVDHH